MNAPSGLEAAVKDTCRDYSCALAEEFIEGEEITVGLLESRHTITALPVLQLKPANEFYDFEAKYRHGLTEFVVPAEIPVKTAEVAQETAMQVHAALGCRGFNRVDFIIDANSTPQLTETNTLPGMTETSDFPAQAKAAGIGYEELVEKMLRSALLP